MTLGSAGPWSGDLTVGVLRLGFRVLVCMCVGVSLISGCRLLELSLAGSLPFPSLPWERAQGGGSA